MPYQKLFDSLSAEVRGRVAWGEEGTSDCEDFGRNFRLQPKIVVHATCEDDIRHTLRLAGEAGRTVAVRGAGHSCNSQSITDDVLLINSAPDDDGAAIEFLEGDRVQVPTRYSWMVLERALNRRRRMFPVLTDNLGTSIGGTLSVGGFGIRSAFFGAQVDQVERLKLVLPTGEARWCSPDENPELFAFSLAGLSTLGVIESVVLKTVPWQEPIVYRRCDYAKIGNLDEAIEDALLLLDDPRTRYVRLPGFPTNQGPLPNVPLWLEYGQDDTEANRREANPLLPEAPNRTHSGPQVFSNFTFAAHEQDKQYVDSFADFAKVWCDFFFPRQDYVKFLPHFRELLDEKDLAIIYVMFPRRPADAPRIPLHPVKETGRQYVSLGADFIIPRRDTGSIRHARDRMNHLLGKCIELGGRPYLYGGIDFDDREKRRLFGDDYDRLQQLKAECDPRGVITSTPFLPGRYPRIDVAASEAALSGPHFATTGAPRKAAVSDRSEA